MTHCWIHKEKTEKATVSIKILRIKQQGKLHTNHQINIKQLQAEFHAATIGLGKLHPDVIDKNDERRKTLLEACGMRNSITDSIISTMLSQNTTDKNSKGAWKNLKRLFPTWETKMI